MSVRVRLGGELYSGRDKRVPGDVANRRGTPVVPAEARWIIQCCVADLTSRSLQEARRRGTLVVPAEARWIIQWCVADLTSRSLQEARRRGTPVVPDKSRSMIQCCAADLTSASLRKADLTSGFARVGGLDVNRPKAGVPRTTTRHSHRQKASGVSPQDTGLVKMGLYGLPK
jgi:hypothetical protein